LIHNNNIVTYLRYAGHPLPASVAAATVTGQSTLRPPPRGDVIEDTAVTRGNRERDKKPAEQYVSQKE
jgi:hypothetical protein